jgi:hypothetical protein
MKRRLFFASLILLLACLMSFALFRNTTLATFGIRLW